MKYTDIEIDGTDVESDLVVSNGIAWTLEQSYSDNMDKLTANFSQNLGTTVSGLKPTMTFEVWEGYSANPKSTGTKIFSGFVGIIEKHVGGYIIHGFDKLWQSIRREVTKVYDKDLDASAGNISLIFADLVNTHADLSGTTGTGGTIQDSGSTYTLAKYKCDHADVFERMKTLADVLDWQFYYKASDDKVYFEEKGYDMNSNIIHVGGDDNNVVRQPKWKEEALDGLVNSLTIIGNDQEFIKTETGASGATGVTLTWTPESVRVTIDGNEIVGGMPDASASYDYYVDKIKKRVIFNNGATGATGAVSIEYVHKVPSIAIVEDEPSIAKYGITSKTIFYKDVLSVDDAEKRGRRIVESRSTPPNSTKLTIAPRVIESLNINVGQRIYVNDSLNSKEIFVIVRTIKRFFPEKDIELMVGDKFWNDSDFNSDTSERVRRLEEEQFSNLDLIRQIKKVGTNFRLDRDKITVSYRGIGNSFVLGHAINGKLGTQSPQPLLGWQGDGSWTEHYTKTY